MIKINHYHILLADDEYYLRESLKRKITEIDPAFRVSGEASNGQEALEILKKGNIQIVITDIRMPVMDGLELSRIIHELYPDIVVLVLTGYADFEYARTSIRYGVFDYLLKPVENEALENALGRVQEHLRHIYELPDEGNVESQSAEEIVHSAISYLQEHYMEDIDIGNLAKKYGFTSAYLTKLFNRYADESPLKYLTRIRINEARKLLLDPSLSIRQVGEMVGYPDQFHFSKTFRKLTGLNPSAYRKQENEA